MTKKIQNLKNNIKPIYFDATIGIVTSIFFSAFIYLENFDITIKLLNTIFGILALALLLYIPKRAILISGFFIGLFWFYWIGYSFKYNGVGYLTPFITLGFALIYTLFFGVIALTNRVIVRALIIFALSFFEPMDFNWLQIELLFVDSYMGIFKYQLFLILLSLSLLKYIKKPFTFAPLILMLFALDFNSPIPKEAPLKIKLINTNIKQEDKWLLKTQKPQIAQNIAQIKSAVKEGFELVVLPESTFPIYLNKNYALLKTLKDLSFDISIVAGTLLREDNKNYNVSYFFQNGEVQIAKKMVLVPFGEYIPLPKFAQKIINDIFFNGEADFSNATKPTDFIIKGIKFRNAICYEATCQEIYDGDVNFVIAISNNAWFAPSIEPTLQKLLMRYYARKNSTTIYHSANHKGTGIIN